MCLFFWTEDSICVEQQQIKNNGEKREDGQALKSWDSAAPAFILFFGVWGQFVADLQRSVSVTVWGAIWDFSISVRPRFLTGNLRKKKKRKKTEELDCNHTSNI